MFKKLIIFSGIILFTASLLYAAGPGMRVRDPLLETTIPSTNVEGVSKRSTINKFGRSVKVDNGVLTDIWDQANVSDDVDIWVAPTTARVHDIVSSSTGDDGDPVGTGTRTVKVTGLTDWDIAEVSETITMNGTSNVATTNSYVIIYKMEAETWGTSTLGPNVGTLTATAQTDSTVTAQIGRTAGAGAGKGNGQTQMAIFGIPSTQKLYIGRLYANLIGLSGGNEATIRLLVNDRPDDELTNFLTFQTFGLRGGGSSALSVNYYVPKVVLGPAIVKIQAVSDNDDMDISAGFDGIVIDN